jgi:hypothetical protein
MSQDLVNKLDAKIVIALKALETVLREYYKNDAITIGYRLDDCEAFEMEERWGMTDHFAAEDLDCRIEDALDKLGFFIEWQNEVIFWLFEI